MIELLLLILSAQVELADCVDARGNYICGKVTLTPGDKATGGGYEAT